MQKIATVEVFKQGSLESSPFDHPAIRVRVEAHGETYGAIGECLGTALVNLGRHIIEDREYRQKWARKSAKAIATKKKNGTYHGSGPVRK